MILTGYDDSGNPVKKTATTDANGNYAFTGLIASNGNGYRIVQVIPLGYTQIGADPGSTGSLGSPSGKFITTFLNTNTTSTGNDFLDATSNG